jgi:hypothetical protein
MHKKNAFLQWHAHLMKKNKNVSIKCRRKFRKEKRLQITLCVPIPSHKSRITELLNDNNKQLELKQQQQNAAKDK